MATYATYATYEHFFEQVLVPGPDGGIHPQEQSPQLLGSIGICAAKEHGGIRGEAMASLARATAPAHLAVV